QRHGVGGCQHRRGAPGDGRDRRGDGHPGPGGRAARAVHPHHPARPPKTPGGGGQRDPPRGRVGAPGRLGPRLAERGGAARAWWVPIGSGGGGRGTGGAGLTYAATTGAARSGTVTIAGRTFTATQAAAPAPCTFTISPTSDMIDRAGGTSTVTVTASQATCAWTASSNVPWMSVSTGSGNGESGTGNGTVRVTGDENRADPRTGTATIAVKTCTV